MAKEKKKSSPRRKSKVADFKAVLAATAQAAAKVNVAAAGAVTRKVVTFTCSNPICVVGITSGSLNFAFTGSGAAAFPLGQSDIFFRVRGSSRSVTLSAQGGTLNPPVAGTPTFSGLTTLTVV